MTTLPAILGALTAIARPLPRHLPKGVHAVQQGCRVTYFESKRLIDELTPADGKRKDLFCGDPQEGNDHLFLRCICRDAGMDRPDHQG